MAKRDSKKPLIHVEKESSAELEKHLSPVALRSVGPEAAEDIGRARNIETRAKAGSDRLPFERDRDRIMHARQLRRLTSKTQVFIVPVDGDIRSRLTHSLEVYQIATSIGRRLNLNVPAIEAMALGHDVGHTPFGHAGEAELDEILSQSGLGGFHHAAHSVWALDHTSYDERKMEHESTCGLNLTYAVREGILRHGWFVGREYTPYHLPPNDGDSHWDLAGPTRRNWGSVEAQVVSFADQLAYLNHDIEDLLSFGFNKILSVPVLTEFFSRHKSGHENREWERLKQEFLKVVTEDSNGRVKLLVRNVIDASVPRVKEALEKGDWTSAKIVNYDTQYQHVRELFYRFFGECVYSDVRVEHRNARGRECVRFLFDFFFRLFQSNPDLLPTHISDCLDDSPPWWRGYFGRLAVNADYLAKYSSPSSSPKDEREVACQLAARDIVAHMTDTEALAAFRALQKAESQSGMSSVERALSAFPSKAQRDERRRTRNVVHDAVREIVKTSIGG